MKAPLCNAVVVLALVAFPSTASAWTEAQVDGVGATVDLASDGTAQVNLRLSIAVQRGWLSALELRGLPPNLRLLNPWLALRGEEGDSYRPEVSVGPEGTLELAFERRGAPRRGQYRTLVKYQARLSESQVRPLGNDWVRVFWTLPAWETGLNNVEVKVILPKGARPVQDDTAPAIAVTQRENPNRTTLTWKRVQLPRLTPWTVTFEIPAAKWTAPEQIRQATNLPTPALFTTTSDPAPSLTAVAPERLPTWLLSALLALLCFAKRQMSSRTSLIPASTGVSVVLLTAMTSITAPPWLWLSWIGMVVMSLKRRPRYDDTARLGQWYPVQPLKLGQAPTRRRDFLDATTPIGLVTLTAVGAIVWSMPGHSLASLMFFAPVFFCGTRFQDGISAESRHRRVLQFMATVRVPRWLAPLAFEPVACVGGDGRWIDARIRILSERWVQGMHRVDFAVADERAGLNQRPVVGVLVVVRAASAADDLVRSRLRNLGPTHASRTRAAFFLPYNDATLKVLHELVEPISEQAIRDSGTWLLDHARAIQATRSAA